MLVCVCVRVLAAFKEIATSSDVPRWERIPGVEVGEFETGQQAARVLSGAQHARPHPKLPLPPHLKLAVSLMLWPFYLLSWAPSLDHPWCRWVSQYCMVQPLILVIPLPPSCRLPLPRSGG